MDPAFDPGEEEAVEEGSMNDGDADSDDWVM